MLLAISRARVRYAILIPTLPTGSGDLIQPLPALSADLLTAQAPEHAEAEQRRAEKAHARRFGDGEFEIGRSTWGATVHAGYRSATRAAHLKGTGTLEAVRALIGWQFAIA